MKNAEVISFWWLKETEWIETTHGKCVSLIFLALSIVRMRVFEGLNFKWVMISWCPKINFPASVLSWSAAVSSFDSSNTFPIEWKLKNLTSPNLSAVITPLINCPHTFVSTATKQVIFLLPLNEWII